MDFLIGYRLLEIFLNIVQYQPYITGPNAFGKRARYPAKHTLVANSRFKIRSEIFASLLISATLPLIISTFNWLGYHQVSTLEYTRQSDDCFMVLSILTSVSLNIWNL